MIQAGDVYLWLIIINSGENAREWNYPSTTYCLSSKIMIVIKEIAQQALKTGYLSLVAQKRMQLLLQSNYDSDDLDAYIILQRAVVAGDVKPESPRQTTTSKDAAVNIKTAYQVAAETAFAAAIALSTLKGSNEHPSLGT